MENENGIILLPFASNGNLDALIERKNLNYTQKCIILYGIAVGMLKFHDQGISHKNLHPHNILINNNLEPWISGFLLPFSHMYYDICYVAPEILLNDEKMLLNDECLSDVYSFGMIAYYLFTGIKPWKNIGNIFTIYQKIVDGKRPSFPNDIEQPIINLISKCWETTPENRPTFKEICDLISDHNFYFNSNYLFDMKKFYDYQLNLGELNFIKFSQNQIEKFEKNSENNNNFRKAVCFKGERINLLGNYFEVANYFKKALIDSDPTLKSYTVPSNMTEKLFKNGLFMTKDFNKIIENFEKISIEIKYPSDSFIPFIKSISCIIGKNKNKIRIVIIISEILCFIGLPKIEFPFFVVIQSPVNSIGNEAFKDCISLKKIIIPSSVTKIGKSAFEGCISLKKIEIPSSISKIGENAFNKCILLNSISFPSSMKSSFQSKYYGIDDKTTIVFY